MWWVVFWAVVTLIGALGTVASINRVRFAHRVEREAADLAASATDAFTPVPLSSLPLPVQRYLRIALGDRSGVIRRVRLQHGGSFRPSLTSRSWLPIQGRQYFNASPPGFIWWGRVRMAPGLWIDARDRSVQGAGSMWVTVESTFTIADATGPELDRGALVRLLGELAWLPTTYLDPRYVSWTPVDDRRATATLHVNGRRVAAEFAFDADGLPTSFSAERYRDLGDGKSALTPFVGRLTDFRRVEGVLVPHRAMAAWVIDGQTFEYANFEVRKFEFDWSGQ